MANRHLSRSIALQTLFEWDFNGYDDKKTNDVFQRNVREFAPGMGDSRFADILVKSVLKNKNKLDEIIEKDAPEWPIEQIARVDRNVLRLGLYELLFGNREEVPPKVAINEAIELGKTFGGDSSGRFVNGVLGTVYREIGEPGKDDSSTKNKKLDVKDLPVEKLAGGVVFREDKKNIYFALVHDVFGYWTLAKGHLADEDNSPKEGALRNLKKELGIKNGEVISKIGSNEYIASDPEKGPVRKKVDYFLVKTKDEELELESSGGLDDARWFSPKKLEEIETYEDIKPLLEKSVELIGRA